MEVLYVLALIFVVMLSILAIFSNRFDDNILQRIGLSVIGFSSCADLYLMYLASECCTHHNSRSLFIVGFAIYGIGTLMKVYRHN